jgi:hypothetical protein
MRSQAATRRLQPTKGWAISRKSATVGAAFVVSQPHSLRSRGVHGWLHHFQLHRNRGQGLPAHWPCDDHHQSDSCTTGLAVAIDRQPRPTLLVHGQRFATLPHGLLSETLSIYLRDATLCNLHIVQEVALWCTSTKCCLVSTWYTRHRNPKRHRMDHHDMPSPNTLYRHPSTKIHRLSLPVAVHHTLYHTLWADCK